MKNRGRPPLPIAELFKQFTSTRTGRKLKSMKGNNEMWINKFFKLLHNKLLRYHLWNDFDCRFSDFYSYVEGCRVNENQKNANGDDDSKKYLLAILGCPLWPISFLKKQGKEIFTNYDKNKTKLTINCCKELRDYIPGFQEVINVFVKCLLGQMKETCFNESFLNSVFQQDCDSIYNKEIRQEIWNSLISDHLSFVGVETGRNLRMRKIEKLLCKLNGKCDIDPYSYETSIEESYRPSITDIQSDPLGKSSAKEGTNIDLGVILEKESSIFNPRIEENLKNDKDFSFFGSPDQEVFDQTTDSKSNAIQARDMEKYDIFQDLNAGQGEIFMENDRNPDSNNFDTLITGGDMNGDYFDEFETFY